MHQHLFSLFPTLRERPCPSFPPTELTKPSTCTSGRRDSSVAPETSLSPPGQCPTGAATCASSGTLSRLFLPFRAPPKLAPRPHILIPSGSRCPSVDRHTDPPLPLPADLGTMLSDSVFPELTWKVWFIESGYFCPHSIRKSHSSEYTGFFFEILFICWRPRERKKERARERARAGEGQTEKQPPRPAGSRRRAPSQAPRDVQFGNYSWN